MSSIENVVYFTYDAKKNREHHGEHPERGQEYAIPGVPLQDLLLTDYEQLPVHMQQSVDAAPFYTATKAGKAAIAKREADAAAAQKAEERAAKRAEKSDADAAPQEVTDGRS